MSMSILTFRMSLNRAVNEENPPRSAPRFSFLPQEMLTPNREICNVPLLRFLMRFAFPFDERFAQCCAQTWPVGGPVFPTLYPD